ncbi:aminopeptidase N [Bacteriovoracaceae bacterium]|nr:aminopeptidase N [Bacteriovoracaceae bacterium]
MKEPAPKTIYLKDYKVPNFLIETIHLTFDLHDTATKVTTKMKIKKNSDSKEGNDLLLNGEELKFVSAEVSGKVLDSSQYDLQEDTLTILNAPDSFELVINNEIDPTANTALDGLYKSGDIFCTQNEPEGFRRITYFMDRPDVMAKFTTKIIADKKLFPTLLSNGNLVGEGDLDNGRHWVEWEDPFLKPAYLYALVAGDLGMIQDTYTTMNNRKIDLRIYCDKGNESRCFHAMESLNKSMKWDEDTFGLEYDLDIYMIVAVDSFNMGAMENKGLNIFNSVYVLANPETATDDNFLGIESVVGHEYFHNWTGNRITCRDWFQLTLKEGLTVFRDQEFSSDLNDRTVQRIQDVARLRGHQFVEDAGPNAHPIKPDHYMEINNFYTATIYEKGAEVIRMIRTFLGRDGFRKGMDKYFELFDGQAVTTEDFLHAMSVANDNLELTQFKNWYKQAGTPEVTVNWEYKEGSILLTVEQNTPATPNQPVKEAYHFPLGVALLEKDGSSVLKLDLASENGEQPQLDNGVLHIRKKKETFSIKANEGALPSLNRGFTAPIKLIVPYTTEDYLFLMANESDAFNRYEATQVLAKKMIDDILEGREVDSRYFESFELLLNDKNLPAGIKALCLSTPSLTILLQAKEVLEVHKVDKARSELRALIATKLESSIINLYQSLVNELKEYNLDGDSIAKRSLKNTLLGYISKMDSQKTLVFDQFEQANNMTDEISAFSIICNLDDQRTPVAIDKFYKKWKGDTLVIQKWLSALSSSSLDSTYDKVQELEKDAVFNWNVPNLVRSVYWAFSSNKVQFHHESGRGYELVADKIIKLDSINPQIASRIVTSFNDYKRMPSRAQALMKTQLEKIVDHKGISKNVYERADNVLNS